MVSTIMKWLKDKLLNKLEITPGECTKLVFLSATFFFIIASYSILRSLKTSIFLGFVGREYQPYTRFIPMILIVPCLLAYAKLVDKVKRHQIVYTILGIYAALGFIFVGLLSHPTIGVQNTTTSPYRLLGWAFEIYMDLYSALVVSTFWGFVNSVCTTSFANKSYGFIVATSRIGGITTPLLALLVTNKINLPDTISIPLLVMFGALLLFGAILSVRGIIKYVPENDLVGYKGNSKQEQLEQKNPKEKTGLLEGLSIMLKEPYVLGIFGLVYSIEVISTLFEYQWLTLLSIQTKNHVGNMSSLMFLYTSSFQALGFIFAFFGVSTLLKHIGLRSCLLIMPIGAAILAISFLMYPNLIAIFLVLVTLRALNYGFNYPIREILYIPTTKNIQFKSKSWIESFGKTFSKSSGSLLNIISIANNPMSCLYTNSIFSIIFALGYAGISFFMGKRYSKTIAESKTIGKDI